MADTLRGAGTMYVVKAGSNRPDCIFGYVPSARGQATWLNFHYTLATVDLECHGYN